MVTNLSMETTKARFMHMLQQQQRIINSLCAVYYPEPDDLKDARQDVILQLWKAWPGFRQAAETSTWVYRVALNTLLNKKRTEQKRPVASSIFRIEDSALSTTAQHDDDLELLKQIIDWLDDLEKAIVVLHLEGYKYREIASMLDMTPSNVSTRMNRIKTKLKAFHQQISHEPG